MMQINLSSILALIFCVPFAICSEKPDVQTGKDMIERAVAKTNILALSAFEMKAAVHIHEQGKDVNGTYRLAWNGPDRWREEVNLPGYEEVSVGGKGIVWQKQSATLSSELAYYVRSALGFGSSPTASLTAGARSDETIKGVRERRLNGSEAWCWEVVDSRKATREVCIDEATEVVIRPDPLKDTDFVNVGSKRYPNSVRWKGDGDSGDHMEIQIQTTNTNPTFAPGTFDRPSGVTSRPGCLDFEPIRLVTKVPANYPENERRTRIEGRVALAVLVGADGIPKGVELLSAPSRGLAQSSADAIQHWRYDPATCRGIPVEQRIVVVTKYALEYR